MHFYKFIVATCLVITSTSALSAEIAFTPRASLSFSQYDFAQSERPGALTGSGLSTNDFPEVTFNVTFKLIGLGGTFSKEHYYLDIFTQQSSEEEDSFSFPPANFKETFKGTRSDFSITFGKKILENLGAIYIGYKKGESEADGNQGQSLTFKESGIFIGANYAWRVAKGALVFNIAYANLNGDLNEKVTNAGLVALPISAPLDINATSDAQGVSYGLSYSANLSKNLNYSIGIDSQKYTFGNIKDSNPNAIVSDTFTEKFVSTKFTIFYSF